MAKLGPDNNFTAYVHMYIWIIGVWICIICIYVLLWIYIYTYVYVRACATCMYTCVRACVHASPCAFTRGYACVHRLFVTALIDCVLLTLRVCVCARVYALFCVCALSSRRRVWIHVLWVVIESSPPYFKTLAGVSAFSNRIVLTFHKEFGVTFWRYCRCRHQLQNACLLYLSFLFAVKASGNSSVFL